MDLTEPVKVLSRRVEGDRLIVEFSMAWPFPDAQTNAPQGSAPAQIAATSGRRCANCNGPLIAMRADAKYCSANCRQQGFLHRKDRLS